MRKSRLVIEGAWYHVTARTNRKELLLQSALAKNLFVNLSHIGEDGFIRAQFRG